MRVQIRYSAILSLSCTIVCCCHYLFCDIFSCTNLVFLPLSLIHILRYCHYPVQSCVVDPHIAGADLEGARGVSFEPPFSSSKKKEIALQFLNFQSHPTDRAEGARDLKSSNNKKFTVVFLINAHIQCA